MVAGAEGSKCSRLEMSEKEEEEKKKKLFVGSQTQPPSAGPFPPQLQCFRRSRCWWERTKNWHFFVLSRCNEVSGRGNEKNIFVSTRWLNQGLLCVYTRFMFKTETNRPQTSEWVISYVLAYFLLSAFVCFPAPIEFSVNFKKITIPLQLFWIC